tara:strand:- start:1647 stop:2108 length:462 start_codon:yes stop_codon:yes gene_type:complete
MDRTPREDKARNKKPRRKSWAPASSLDLPEPPEGYKYRWIRESVMGYDDKNNMYKRKREGYEPLRAEEVAGFDVPIVDEGKYAGLVGNGGLIAHKVPVEIAEERDEYFRQQTDGQMEAVDNDWMRDNDSRMPKLSPERKSSVSFGRARSNNED